MLVVAQLCPILCHPMDCSTPGFPVLHHLSDFAQTHAHWVGDAIQPSHPLSSLLLLPSIFPSIRVFSNESALCIRWPKYWDFSISLSNEYSGLISFKIGWFDLPAVQGTLKGFLQPQFKSINSSAFSLFFPPTPLSLLHGPTLTSIHDYWKNHNLLYEHL